MDKLIKEMDYPTLKGPYATGWLHLLSQPNPILMFHFKTNKSLKKSNLLINQIDMVQAEY